MTETDGTGTAGKVVAITGAGRGIGAVTARLLAARGARVVLGSRGEQELTSTADAIAASGGQVAYRSVDVTRPEVGRAG
jgi:NADP-dependent 3-hydroxy acid dehydrogenase YdfG